MKPGKHFNLSKSTKRVMASMLGQRSSDYKRAMIEAELAASIQPKRERRQGTQDAGL
jgi:hypothetical protein